MSRRDGVLVLAAALMAVAAGCGSEGPTGYWDGSYHDGMVLRRVRLQISVDKEANSVTGTLFQMQAGKISGNLPITSGTFDGTTIDCMVGNEPDRRDPAGAVTPGLKLVLTVKGDKMEGTAQVMKDGAADGAPHEITLTRADIE